MDGCDVARCTECGFQRISCGCKGSKKGWGAIWTGEWPGDEVCRELGLWCLPDKERRFFTKCESGTPGAVEDLNAFHSLCMFGRLVWSKQDQKWKAPE